MLLTILLLFYFAADQPPPECQSNTNFIMDEIERTLLVKPELFVYKIPPRTSAKGYRAADWKLDQPDWTGRLRCLVKGTKCELRLEDKHSGELFAACPIDTYPSMTVESVTDSSRYFVICIQDAGRKAYIGIGFADRSDSFDFNVALQDHFKQLKKEDQFVREASEPAKPNLDLAFKDGQTIRINIPKQDGMGKAGGPAASTRPKGKGPGQQGFLPPPPGGMMAGIKLPASVSSGSLVSVPVAFDDDQSSVIGGSGSTSTSTTMADLLGGDFSSTTTSIPTPSQQPAAPGSGSAATTTEAAAATTAAASSTSGFSDLDDWGDFATPKAPSTQTVSSGSWEQF
jgi:hypothetical protein